MNVNDNHIFHLLRVFLYEIFKDLELMRTDRPMSTTVSSLCAISRRIDRMLTFSIPATSGTVSKVSGVAGSLRSGIDFPSEVSPVTAWRGATGPKR